MTITKEFKPLERILLKGKETAYNGMFSNNERPLNTTLYIAPYPSSDNLHIIEHNGDLKKVKISEIKKLTKKQITEAKKQSLQPKYEYKEVILADIQSFEKLIIDTENSLSELRYQLNKQEKDSKPYIQIAKGIRRRENRIKKYNNNISDLNVKLKNQLETIKAYETAFDNLNAE